MSAMILHSNTPDVQTVISGSFRKHLQQIFLLRRELEQHNIAVLSPIGSGAINPQDEFVVLDTDPISHPKVLQDSVFAKIRRSTFLVVANVDGYLGRAAVLEMGYAIAHGITIYTLELVEDPNLLPYCQPLQSIFPAINYGNLLLNPTTTLSNILDAI